MLLEILHLVHEFLYVISELVLGERKHLALFFFHVVFDVAYYRSSENALEIQGWRP